jgi:hypothetical protein
MVTAEQAARDGRRPTPAVWDVRLGRPASEPEMAPRKAQAGRGNTPSSSARRGLSGGGGNMCELVITLIAIALVLGLGICFWTLLRASCKRPRC